ncbi:hypothetical protein BDZ89DRAFT_253374 [Hymenopellis radicata]|nr:hypothetical protein BDZ89DRAFT_253374 [Hymenopellis radicata]
MPLIVHASSTCDVCLNPYVFDGQNTDQSPHTIPCGHIFCRECLQSIVSMRSASFLMPTQGNGVCPLCRKPFRDMTAVRKLHMDAAPTEPEIPSQSEEQVFLQRLMTLSWVSSESNDEQETRETVIAETETWLSSQADDEATELRGALNALKEHRKNVNKRRQAENKVREVEARAAMAESGNEALQARLDQMTAELEEMRVQMRTVEENAAAAVAQKKSRKGKEKEVISHNPLPLPPEDISNRYGDFSRRALQDIPLTQTELNTPIPYPPQLNLPPVDFPPTQVGSKSTTAAFFPYSEIDRIRAQDAAQPPSRHDIVPGAPAEAGVSVKKEKDRERKHKKKHRSRDVAPDMSQVRIRDSEVYPGGYVPAPFPVHVEEETPRPAVRNLDSRSQRTISFQLPDEGASGQLPTSEFAWQCGHMEHQ